MCGRTAGAARRSFGVLQYSPPGLTWPKNDAEASQFIRAKYTKWIPNSKLRFSTYAETRKARLGFFKDFSGMRKCGVAGVQAYAEGLFFFSKLGMAARCQMLFDLALEDHILPTNAMYLRVLAAYALIGHLEGVAYMLRKAALRVQTRDMAADCVAQAVLALHRAGERYWMVRIVVETWPIHDGSYSVHNAMLGACRSFEQGSAVMNDMMNRDQRFSAADWGLILDSGTLQGDVGCAVKTFALMKELGAEPTQIHLTMLMQAWLECGDIDGFRKTYQVFTDKGLGVDDDPFCIGLFLRSCELTQVPIPQGREGRALGNLREVELRVGVHSARGDFKAAHQAFRNRGVSLNSLKVWGALYIRLYAAALYNYSLTKGNPPSLLVKYAALGPVEEKRGISEGYLNSLTTMSYAARGFGAIRIWRMVSGLHTSADLKRSRIPLYGFYRTAHCLAARIRHLHGRPGQAARVRQHLDALEELYRTVYRLSPWKASMLLRPLLIAYGCLGLVERAVSEYRLLLLAGHPAHLLRHQETFRALFALREDTAALSHMDTLQATLDSYHTCAQIVK
eukprot:TRINITY_DN6627_c0_g1_i1.p1 TRINITY_DN6627_c0_g1~~TRINITY_DN6627_c0_g1_i1.p1  ORF type:complete len:565 (+),score=165.62 TRINITY_DN6627_c0_g1_i1:246-1940(+)